MQITLTPEAEQALKSLVASGITPDEIVAEALTEKAQREGDRTAIQLGIDEMRAGQLHTFEEVDREIRDEFGFAPTP